MESFFGAEVAAGKEVKPKMPDNYVLRLSQAALPAGAAGRVTLFVTVDGKTLAIGTLDANAKAYQLSIDLVFGSQQQFSLSAKGTGSVHVTGFMQPTGDDDFGGEMSGSDEEGSDEEGDDEEMDFDEDDMDEDEMEEGSEFDGSDDDDEELEEGEEFEEGSDDEEGSDFDDEEDDEESDFDDDEDDQPQRGRGGRHRRGGGRRRK